MRKQHNLKPFEIPKALQKELPFRYKPKQRGKFVDPIADKRVAVVRDGHEKKRDQLIERLKTIQTANELKVTKARTRK